MISVGDVVFYSADRFSVNFNLWHSSDYLIDHKLTFIVLSPFEQCDKYTPEERWKCQTDKGVLVIFTTDLVKTKVISS